MNSLSYQRSSAIVRSMLAAGTLALAALLATPASSQAAVTAANATIRNVVKVTYSDAAGSGSFSASASVTATVNLLAATPGISNPTPASGQSVVSGSTQSYTFDIFSNANGSDTYTLSIAAGTAADTVSGTPSRYIVSTTNPQGVTTATGNTTTTSLDVTIGASVILSDNNVDTVSVPAGSLNGIAAGDFVIINNIKYKVAASGTTAGTPQGYDSANHALTTETYATIKLLVSDGSGGWTAADFSSVNMTGLVISQLYEVTMAISATAPAGGGDAYFKAKIAVKSDGTLYAEKDDVKTTFTAPNVTIAKAVNPTSAKPGEFLEYTITVTGSETIKSVTVSDAVPKYTKLVSYTTTYAGGGAGDATYDNTHVFATITKNGGTAAQITGTSGNDDTNATDVGFGNVSGGTADSPMTFYLGTGSSNSAGGTVANTEVYVIKYTVEVL